jgi:hypothetical protein
MWRSVVIAVALAGTLAGCSWEDGAGSTSRSGWTAYPTGTIAGRIVVSGGVQFPGVKGPFPAMNTPFTFVAAPATGAVVVRRLRTDRAGRFRVALPPGRYKVGATFIASEPLRQAAGKLLVVGAGHTVHVRLTEEVH